MIPTKDTLTVDALTAGDWPAVGAIFREGIESGDATFESEVPSWEEWDAAHLEQRLVARRDGEVVGWAALSPTSGRCVYRGVAESSIYVAAAARGQGVGKTLLTALVEQSEAAGIWTLEAGIFPETVASLLLHESCGFRVVGIRKRLGKHGDVSDVVFLERRSEEIG